MKKVIIFLIAISAIFAGIVMIKKMNDNEKMEENIYKKNDLHRETISQLDDPLYQNIILPEELEKKLENKEDVTVYFFSPTCSYCVETTPIVAPLAKEMDIDLVQYNVLEFEEGWEDYHLEATPTIIHFENGEEKERIEGYNEEDVFKDWFSEHVK